MKKNIVLLLLSTILISCLRNEGKKQEDAIVAEEEEKEKKDTILFNATVMAEKGLPVKDQPDLQSNEVGVVPYQGKIGVTELTKKLKKTIEHHKTIYGKWLKITYTSTASDITGYILDTAISYNHKMIKKTYQDTVTVKNEHEFLLALASNRMIMVETDTLNIDQYYNQFVINKNSTSDDENKKRHYKFTTGGNLELHNINNLTLKSSKKQIHFIIHEKSNNVLTIEGCSNFIIDGFNFYHTEISGNCDGKVCVINQSKNGLFINTEFNGSGAIGAEINNSENIKFNHSKFYNNSSNAIHLSHSNNIRIENSILYENDSYSIIEINNESKARIDAKKLPMSVQVSHTMFIKNVTSAILKIANPNSSDYNLGMTFSNCKFMDNTLASFISYQKPKNNVNILFDYCEIIDNESTDNDFNFIHNQGAADTITFQHSIISNNENSFQLDISKMKLKNTIINRKPYPNTLE